MIQPIRRTLPRPRRGSARSPVVRLVVGFALVLAFLAPALSASAADATMRVDENPEAGWGFNQEEPYTTAAGFTGDEASLGAGSLHVAPIVNDVNARKLILRYVPGAPVAISDLASFSIDFLIDDAGSSFAPNQFYLNLYTRRASAGESEWYSCRYDYVASAGSTASWTALGFDASSTPPTSVATRPGNPDPCAATPSGEGDHAFLFLSVNLGDTSGNDEGVGGYFDNAKLTIDGMTTTFDFEQYALPVVTDVDVTPKVVAAGAEAALTALATDTGDGASTIASASYDLDGVTAAMAAVDGAFDEISEALVADVTAPDEAGIYPLCVAATNVGGVSSEPACVDLVVYDPDGGFVTGGGWIDSPEGAGISSTLVWDQDFEAGAEGWLDSDDAWYGDITASGGSAVVTGDAISAPFSRFDGYRDTWTGDWTAEIDVYLDPDWPAGSGFDYSVAASGADGAHQRDYIFHVGVVEVYGPIVGRALLVNGSNNADFYTNPFKLVNDNGGDYLEVADAGWYTLQHELYDAGGYLAVDLNLLDANGDLLWTATRENVGDTIPGEVGGNRYAWFTHVDVPDGVEVDDHQLWFPAPTPGGKATFGFISKYKKGASTPNGSAQFSFQAGGLNFHSDVQDWLVVTGNDHARFKGEGTINGEGACSFMIWAGDGADSGDPDTFRIKIWEESDGGEVVIYDNGMDQPIGGGQIIVHAPKGKP